jgi:membrane carboxypeptidase/penicillin-binding protein
MVGGYDFEGSEYNRATQARRQVGSTFKPIVYAAAIGTRKFTGGTLVQDAPLVFQTLGDKTWKPGNYGEEYEGNITLRRALQLSKNVCTVRVLDRIGLDPVFDLAGPTLRIGYNTPTCSRRHIKSGSACEGDRTPSAVDGMEWCSYCDPASCPLVRSGQQKIRKNGADIPVGEVMACLDEPRDINGEPWCHSCDVNLRACDWLPIERIPDTDPCVDARQDGEGRIWCRTCDLSMGLGSSSLTMVELARAYSAFATYGQLVEPHFIEKVVDRDGTIIETYEGPDGEWPRVMEPGVASIAHWLLREVATGGTGARTNRLGIQVAGKTGTTNDFFDAWFVGYNPDIITAAWVGFDQPHSMGVSFTGGKTALPIWMDFMRAAVPKDGAPRFKALQGVEMVPIDERSGRVAIGGRSIPMLPGTAPTNVVGEVGQKSGEDLLIDDF